MLATVACAKNLSILSVCDLCVWFDSPHHKMQACNFMMVQVTKTEMSRVLPSSRVAILVE